MAKKEAEKKLAYSLYMAGDVKQNQIAEMVKVSEKTIGEWIDKGGWESLRVARQTTRENIIAKKYRLLEKIVDKNTEKADADTLEPGDIDAEHKMTMGIKALLNEETLSGYIQAFTQLAKWAQINSPAFAKEFADKSQAFLLEKAQSI